jgi:hypothetical protein
MAKVQKTVTFALPDEFEQEVPTTSMGKTSTMEYDGPETLILWINKETKDIEQTWDKDDYTEQPVPLDLEVEELNADTDENTIKIGILFGGFEQRKLYEIRVGPAADKNRVIADPSDPRSIFSENDIVDDYTKPLVFRTDFRRYSDDFIREERNTLLKQTDSRVSESMPEEVKAKWEAHRQKLRDIPADWAAVPNHLIQFPVDPDGEYDEPYVRNEDPEHEVTLVANRTAADADAIAQLTPISGIDE